MKEIGPVEERTAQAETDGDLNTLAVVERDKDALTITQSGAGQDYVKDGVLPEVGLSGTMTLAQVREPVDVQNKATADGHKLYPDILPNIDLDDIREHKRKGDQGPVRYRSMQNAASGESFPLLTEEDRKNSIMYKMENGLVDGSKLFKNPAELLKGKGAVGGLENNQTGQRDSQERTGDNAPGDGLQVREERTPGEQGEETEPRQQQRDLPEREAEAVPLQKFERLEVDEEGNSSVTVKPGDNLWRITREALKHNQEEGFTPSDREIANALKKLVEANPDIRNPDLIKPGDKINIPPEILKPDEVPEEIPEETPRETEEIPEETPEDDGPRVEVENLGASPEFAREMQDVVDSLPPGVRRLLEANGSRVTVGDRVSSVYPELAGVRPRGWPPGTTWDNAEGLYQPRDKRALVTEHKVDPSGEVIETNRAEGVLKHEIGHAVDHALGNFSQSDEFKTAYEQDTQGMTDAERDEFSYLLQSGDAGRSEAFAEVFGALNGASANPHQTQRILEKFPNVANLLRRKLDAL